MLEELTDYDPKLRRYCKKCSKKLYIQNMTYAYYPILGEAYWFCNTCFITRENNVIMRVGSEKISKDFC